MAAETPRTSWGQTIVRRVGTLAHDVESIKTDVARLDTNVAGLRKSVTGIKEEMAAQRAEMKEEMVSLRADMNVLSGDFREFRGEVRAVFVALRLTVTLLGASLVATTIAVFWGAAMLSATVQQHSTRLDRIETRSGPAASATKVP